MRGSLVIYGRTDTTLSASLSEADLLAWGWRIPFLASIVMIGIGMFIRLGVQESPVFEKMKQTGQQAQSPAADLLRRHRRVLLVTIGMKMLQNAVFYIYSVFMLSYIVGVLHMPRSVGLNAVLISSVIGLATIPLWSWLSDLIGRKKVYLFGNIASMAFVLPFFALAETGSVLLITVGMVVGLNVLHDAMYGPQAVYFSELLGAISVVATRVCTRDIPGRPGCSLEPGRLMTYVAERNGGPATAARGPVGVVALAVSGLCCLCFPWIARSAGQAPLLAFMLLWGATVVADSPQFSAMASASCPPQAVGSALALLNSAGFAVTVVAIAAATSLADALDLRVSWLLLPGPVLGLIGMSPLLRKAQAC